MTILVTGAQGQLGSELSLLLKKRNIPFLETDSNNLDITNREKVMAYFQQHRPTFVFHCAAYTAVDAAEDEGKEINWSVNVEGTRNLADAAESIGSKVLYVSTDYVFDGISASMYTEEAPTNPQNEYGKAKLAGEKLILNQCSQSYVVRTSWVFGKYGKNFVHTMLRLADTRDKLTVVSDQVGRPTWTRTLAEFMIHIFESKPEYGIYHLSNDNFCSWYEFATEILKDREVDVQPILSEDYPQKAHRPKNSIMDLSKAKKTGFSIPTWQEALDAFKNEL